MIVLFLKCLALIGVRNQLLGLAPLQHRGLVWKNKSSGIFESHDLSIFVYYIFSPYYIVHLLGATEYIFIIRFVSRTISPGALLTISGALQ